MQSKIFFQIRHVIFMMHFDTFEWNQFDKVKKIILFLQTNLMLFAFFVHMQFLYTLWNMKHKKKKL